MLSRNRSRTLFVLGHDVTMAALSFVASAYLRLGGSLFDGAYEFLPMGTAVFTAAALCVFAALRLHRSTWRYVSLGEVFDIMRAAGLAASFMPNRRSYT